VTQIAIDKRPKLQKFQNTFKIKLISKMANKAMVPKLVETGQGGNITILWN
jgi:hypothetical protein